jgi:hypothetical protein
MTPAELEKQLLAYAGRADEAPPDEAALRAVCEGLALHGAPAGCESTAQRLVFAHLAWIQDHLGAAHVARLEALLDAPAGPARAPESLDRRVLDAVRREAPLPPPPPPAVQPWSLGVPLVCVMGIFVITAFALQPPGGRVATPAPLGVDGGVEVRLDRRAASYASGEKIFVQLAAARSGHLSLLAVTASGQAGVIVGEQPVTAGQVVMSKTTAGATAGKAHLIAVIASQPLGDVQPAIAKLPQPVDVSKVVDTLRALAETKRATIVTGMAELTVTR